MDFTKSELKLILKALKILQLISGGGGMKLTYFEKLDAVHNKAEALLKEA